MVHVALGRLSMQLINATCEDGVIRQYQPAHIRVRIEERRTAAMRGRQLPMLRPPTISPAGV